MKSITSNLFVVLFICLSVKYVSSLKCYQCDYDRDGKSCQSYNTSMIVTCPPGMAVCRTLKATTATYTYINRSCGILEMENLQDKPHGKGPFPAGAAVSSMICNKDLCNGAAIQQLSAILILFITALSSFIMFKM